MAVGRAPRVRVPLVAMPALVMAGIGAAVVHAGEHPPGFSHPPVSIDGGTFTTVADSRPRPLDEISDYCLACHGPRAGSGESEGGAGEAPRPAHSVGTSDRSHPVEVAYPDGAVGYTPISELDRRLMLVDGGLTCLTCHARDDSDHGLVLPEAQSQICVACHVR